MSCCSVRRSTILPLASSPHLRPTTQVQAILLTHPGGADHCRLGQPCAGRESRKHKKRPRPHRPRAPKEAPSMSAWKSYLTLPRRQGEPNWHRRALLPTFPELPGVPARLDSSKALSIALAFRPSKLSQGRPLNADE